MMARAISGIKVTLVMAIIVLGYTSLAMAFQLTLGHPAASTEFRSNPTTNGADIPTPQFFRATLGNPGPTTAPVMVPKLNVIDPEVAQAETESPAARTSRPALERRLSGSELFLLRDAATVAAERERPGHTATR